MVVMNTSPEFITMTYSLVTLEACARCGVYSWLQRSRKCPPFRTHPSHRSATRLSSYIGNGLLRWATTSFEPSHTVICFYCSPMVFGSPYIARLSDQYGRISPAAVRIRGLRNDRPPRRRLSTGTGHRPGGLWQLRVHPGRGKSGAACTWTSWETPSSPQLASDRNTTRSESDIFWALNGTKSTLRSVIVGQRSATVL